MSKRKTNEEFLNEMYEKHPEIKVRGLYRGAFEKVECECLNCGNVWDAVPKEMTGKKLRGCPRCGISKRNESRRISNKEFLDKLEIAHNGNIVALENYVNAKTKIKFKCLKDGYIWKSEPYRVMNGTGCPMCTNHIKKTEDDFIQMLSERNPDVELVSKYKSMHERALFKCKVCNYEWETSVSHRVRDNSGCPKCALKMSKGETIIYNYLKQNNIEFKKEATFKDCRDKNPLPFDFYLPNQNICIEYDGIQHYRPIDFGNGTYTDVNDNFIITQKHDKIKNEYCKQNNITLIRISYKDKNHIEEILSSKLIP